jgi:hypothetical protein
MALKLDKSSLKEKLNGVTLVGLAMVLLVIILGVAMWLTIKDCQAKEASINSTITTYNTNKLQLGTLKAIAKDFDQFQKIQEEIDKKIAKKEDYSAKAYKIKMYEMCEDYNLEVAGVYAEEMSAVGSVYMANTTVSVVGNELNVRKMIKELISSEQVTKVDEITIEYLGSGQVSASFVVTNIAK